MSLSLFSPHKSDPLIVRSANFSPPLITIPPDTYHHPVLDHSVVFPGWESLFGNEHPVHLEYCSGNGAWIGAKASENSQINWVGVEKSGPRVHKLKKQIVRRNLKNCLAFWAEAHDVTQRFIPDKSVDAIYVNFPDPWPKLRHKKNRLFQPEFIRELSRILKPEGLLTLVTDDFSYGSWSMDALVKSGLFRCFDQDPYYLTELEGYGSSFFEELWRGANKTIHYFRFQVT